jgi:hypothetical protein
MAGKKKITTTKKTLLVLCPRCFKDGAKIALKLYVADKHRSPIMYCDVCSWFRWI